jgi:hypothetical protein
MANITQSQLDAFNDRLKGIKKSVTAEDRALAMETAQVNYVTISRYLNGVGSNLQMAEKLYRFFLGRISEREKLLS